MCVMCKCAHHNQCVHTYTYTLVTLSHDHGHNEVRRVEASRADLQLASIITMLVLSPVPLMPCEATSILHLNEH